MDLYANRCNLVVFVVMCKFRSAVLAQLLCRFGSLGQWSCSFHFFGYAFDVGPPFATDFAFGMWLRPADIARNLEVASCLHVHCIEYEIRFVFCFLIKRFARNFVNRGCVLIF